MRALLIISLSWFAGLALADGINPPDPAAGLPTPGWMDPKYADEADQSAEMGEQVQEASGGSDSQGSAPRQGISETAQALLMQESANQLSKSFREMAKNPLKKSARQNLNAKTVQAGKADQQMHEALRSGQFDNSHYQQVYTQATETITGVKLETTSPQSNPAKKLAPKRTNIAITQNNENKNTNTNVVVIETINLGEEQVPIEVDETEFAAPSQIGPLGLGQNANYARDTLSEGKQKLAKLESKRKAKSKGLVRLARNASSPSIKPEEEQADPNAQAANTKKEKKAPTENLAAISDAELGQGKAMPVGSIEHEVPLRLLAGKLKSEAPTEVGFEFMNRKPASAVAREIGLLPKYHAALELKGAWPFWLLFLFLGGAGVLLVRQHQHYSAGSNRKQEKDSDEEVTAVTKTDTDIQDIA